MKAKQSYPPGSAWQDVLNLLSHFNEMPVAAQVQHSMVGRQVWVRAAPAICNPAVRTSTCMLHGHTAHMSALWPL